MSLDEDNEGVQILAFLASVRMLDETIAREEYDEGRALIEQHAYRFLVDTGTRSPLIDELFSRKLNAQQCAVVLRFLKYSVPRSAQACYAHAGDARTIGYMRVLDWAIREVQGLSAK